MARRNDLVSIGVPVHNGGRTLEGAVGSLTAQSYENLEILISDNASTDETAELGRALAAADSRVTYGRHPGNIGAAANFRSVLAHGTAEYFMWAAADDSWQPQFVERNLEMLVNDATIVGSISKVRWDGEGDDVDLAPGTFPLLGSEKENVRRYLRSARDNSRFYGLFRREALLRSYPERSFFGLDLAVMVGTLRFGGHAEVDEILMTRSRNDPAAYIRGVDADNAPGMERWFPLLPFTRYVLHDLGVRPTPRAVGVLTVRNLYEHVRYFAQNDSAYGRLCRALMRSAQPQRERFVQA